MENPRASYEKRVEWEKEKTVRLNMKLQRSTDADILERLEDAESKQGEIKKLIRLGMRAEAEGLTAAAAPTAKPGRKKTAAKPDTGTAAPASEKKTAVKPVPENKKTAGRPAADEVKKSAAKAEKQPRTAAPAETKAAPAPRKPFAPNAVDAANIPIVFTHDRANGTVRAEYEDGTVTERAWNGFGIDSIRHNPEHFGFEPFQIYRDAATGKQYRFRAAVPSSRDIFTEIGGTGRFTWDTLPETVKP